MYDCDKFYIAKGLLFYISCNVHVHPRNRFNHFARCIIVFTIYVKELVIVLKIKNLRRITYCFPSLDRLMNKVTTIY